MALIFKNLNSPWYTCECWMYHTHYVCTCSGCWGDNEIDVKGNLIKL